MKPLWAILVAGVVSILLFVASFSTLSSWGASSGTGTTSVTGGDGTNPLTPGNGTTPSDDGTPPRGNCPASPNTSNGTGGTPLPYRSSYVIYDTTTGSIGPGARGGPMTYCSTTFFPEYNPNFYSPCNLVNNGSSLGPGFACLDVSRDPNLDAFLIDAWNGHTDLWTVDLQTLTLQRS